MCSKIRTCFKSILKKSCISKGKSKLCEISSHYSLEVKIKNPPKTPSEKDSLLPRGHNIWLGKGFSFNSGIILPACTDTAQPFSGSRDGIQFHKERATETEKTHGPIALGFLISMSNAKPSYQLCWALALE